MLWVFLVLQTHNILILFCKWIFKALGNLKPGGKCLKPDARFTRVISERGNLNTMKTIFCFPFLKRALIFTLYFWWVTPVSKLQLGKSNSAYRADLWESTHQRRAALSLALKVLLDLSVGMRVQVGSYGQSLQHKPGKKWPLYKTTQRCPNLNLPPNCFAPIGSGAAAMSRDEVFNHKSSDF